MISSWPFPPGLRRELGAGSAAITRSVSQNRGGASKQPLRVHASVLKDASLAKTQIRMDQTLRTALGIPFEQGLHLRDDLTLHPLRIGLWRRLHDWLISLFGIRYLFLRVAKPYPPDVEKDVCRMPKDTLSLLGTKEDNRVVLTSCKLGEGEGALARLSRQKIRAFDLDQAMAEKRAENAKGESGKGWSARYVDASRLLGVEIDISTIYLDSHARSALGVEPGDPVKARRSLWDVTWDHLLDIGITLAASILAIESFFAGLGRGYVLLITTLSLLAVITLKLRKMS